MKTPFACALIALCGAVGWCASLLVPDVSPQSSENSAPSLPITSQPGASSQAEHSLGEQGDLFASLLERSKAATEIIETEMWLVAELEKRPAADLAQLIPRVAKSGERRIEYLAKYLVDYWAGRDPASAQQWLLKLPSDEFDSYARLLSLSCCLRDAPSFLGWMENLSPRDRNKLVQSVSSHIAYTVAPKHGKRLADLVAGTGNQAHLTQLTSIYSWWAKASPAEAAAQIRNLSSPEARARVTAVVMEAWAEVDAPGASAFLQTIQDTVVRENARSAYSFGLSRKDPQAALSYLATLPLTTKTEQAVQRVIAEWGRQDAPQALAWVDRQADDPRQAKFYDSILGSLAFRDLPMATAAFLERQERFPDPGDVLKGLMIAAYRKQGLKGIRTYLEQFPQQLHESATVALVNGLMSSSYKQDLPKLFVELPEGPAKEKAAKELAAIKFQTDREESIKWAQSVPAGASRDVAVAEVINRQFYLSTDDAIDLARRLQNKQVAEETIETRLGWWLAENKESAAAYIRESAKLSDEQKRRLLEAQ